MNAEMLRNAVVVAYGRSAVAKAGKGALKGEHPVDFAAKVLIGVLKKVPQLDARLIEDLIVGCAKPEGMQGLNVSRVIAQRAGLPDEVSGQTINRFCASGLQAVATAANAIMAGQADIIVAGGIESMSAIPMAGSDPKLRNAWLLENRPDIYLSMGMTAENVADQFGVERTRMEQFAIESHKKAAAADKAGLFKREIIPLEVADEQGNPSIFDRDQGIRENTSAESLAALVPCFKESGSVTAATSSQVSDGAGFVVLMSAEKAAELSIKPLARFVSFAVAGVPAGMMGIGPMKAVPRAMDIARLTPADMDIIEINEAFAAQALPCIHELGLDVSKVNPRGGAIALGHPLGATGAILTCKALSYLEDTQGRYALVTMCVGGGMGAAGIFERISNE